MANKWPEFDAVIILDANGNQITSFGGSGGTSATDDDAFTAGSGSGTPVMGFFSADTVDAGDVGVLAMDASRRLLVSIEADNVGIGGGTQYTEDAAAAANPVGTALIMVRDDALSAQTTTDGDNVAARGTDKGELYVKHADAIAVTQSGTWDEVGINDSGNSITVDWAGTAPPIGAGVEATALRVTLATDSTGVVSIDDNGAAITVDGTVDLGAVDNAVLDAIAASAALIDNPVVAHDAAVSGSTGIFVIGGTAVSPDGTAPPNRVSTEADATRLATSFEGNAFVLPFGAQLWSYHVDSTSAVQTDASVAADPGDGFALFITEVVFSIGADTASSIFFEETATKILGPWYLPANLGSGLVVRFNTPKKVTSSTALTVTNTGSVTYAIDVTGYILAV